MTGHLVTACPIHGCTAYYYCTDDIQEGLILADASALQRYPLEDAHNIAGIINTTVMRTFYWHA